MPALLLWLRGLLPVFFGLALRAYLAIKGIRFGWRLTMIGAVMALLPLPDWLEALPAKIASLPAMFLFFADLMQLRFGIYVLVSAFATRWIWVQITKSL